ncbi:survival motor neuron protein-like isoform X1 [Dinothrombium tinctorium]|uniref:Survival motor neuron protein-like isoform X1 n=1 Tax=Dinothrombium tinctorium TaxID=1965070 RepID=A0A3S3P7B2_9ACAR|nr:survival motor neuron protein-like isoform X1 [Dinothrombium tinctorium]
MATKQLNSNVNFAESSEESDVWDDDLLIKAYERASKQVNNCLKRKMQKTSAAASKDSDQFTNSSVAVTADSLRALSDDSLANNRKEIKEWRKGHFCRCVYSEDKCEYEAQIVDICKDRGTCIVRYIGYGNEEEQLLTDLMPSKGKSSRKIQEKAAREVIMNETSTPEHHQFTIPSPPKEAQQNDIPFLVPPPPTYFPPPPVKEDDALASMLMSWYMSGYHTGYYQALKHMKSDH